MCWELNEILLMEDQNPGETLVLAKAVAQLNSSGEPTGVVGYTQEVALGFPGGRDKFQRHCSRRTAAATADFSSFAGHPDYVQGEMDHTSWGSWVQSHENACNGRPPNQSFVLFFCCKRR
jgi:hypothetical protein